MEFGPERRSTAMSAEVGNPRVLKERGSSALRHKRNRSSRPNDNARVQLGFGAAVV